MKRKRWFITSMMSASLVVFAIACDSADVLMDDGDNSDGDVVSGDIPAAFQHFTDAVEVYVDGDVVVLQANGIPDHGSPYFDGSDSRYEAYNGDNPNFQMNPNSISEQNLTLRIPLNPVEASNHEATPLGPIGLSLNGVPFYNQYAGPDQPLTREIDSFDQYNGHPQQFGGYHYHIEPLYLTAQNGKEALLGFLLDGFPVYGPEENGAMVTNNDLDEFHGHFGATADYPDGIYHYHITDADPYLNGSGFYGTAGTVSQ